MKIKKSVFILIFINVFALFVFADKGVSKDFKNDYIIGDDTKVINEGTVYEKNIFLYKSKLIIKGKCLGSIIALNSEVIVQGEVKEDLISLFSNIELKDKAIVGRDLLVLGGLLKKSQSSKVIGDYFFSKFMVRDNDLKIKPIFGLKKIHGKWNIFTLIKVLFWTLIMFAFYLLSKDSLSARVYFLRDNLKKIIPTSIILIFSYIFIAFIFVVLSIFVVGIPFLIIQVIIYFISVVYGKLTLYFMISDSCKKNFFNSISPTLLFVIVALLIESLRIIPYLGSFSMVILNLIEFSIGFFYLFKKRFKFI